MPDPLAFDNKFESLFQSEVLTYLSLQQDIQPFLRPVSKSWKDVCQEYKHQWLKSLDRTGEKVVLEGLNSAKGKTLNGKVVKITGKRNPKTHRYPVAHENWLTGESEILTIKFCNLIPSFVIPPESQQIQQRDEGEFPNLIDYTDNAKLLRSQGMMLDQMLMLARWEANSINGCPFKGEYMEFVSLPRGHPMLARLNSSMWTWWTTPPKLAGMCGRGTIVDIVTSSIIKNDFSTQLASEDKLWHQDGPNGQYLARNMIRFMRTWHRDRVTGSFWISRHYKTGSIMVAYDEEDNSFGQVYLVKGHNSVISELVPMSPFFCRATLLPIYDCWTYDGICAAASRGSLSAKGEKSLEDHIQTAIRENKVSWRGPNAANWTYPPPPFPSVKVENDNEVVLDWSSTFPNHEDYSNPNLNTDESEEITPEHVDIGRKIVKAASTNGGIAGSVEAMWVIRRMGYSYKENSEGAAIIMMRGMPIYPFQFHVDHKRGRNKKEKYIPTYKLMDALKGILGGIETGKRLAKYIGPDELAVVRPLESLLTQVFEEKGKTPPTVRWYPPASEEETTYATMFGGP